MRKRRILFNGYLNTVTTCINTMMVLILVGTVVFFVTIADNFGRTLKENFTIEVLLHDSASVQKMRELKTFVSQQDYTRSVRYISKEEATRMQAEAQGTNPNEFLEHSPIPATLEVFLNAAYANSDSLQKFVPMFKTKEFVTDVVYPQNLMDNVNRNIQKVSIALLVVAALLAFVSISLINNTMRMSVARRKHSIQIMKLVGAKWSFIRRPFLRQALVLSLVAALLADGVIYAGIHSLTLWDEEIATLITPMVITVTMLSVLVFGVLLTLISAFLSVNQHLGMNRNDAYLY